MWIDKLQGVCDKLGIEPERDDDLIIFRCASMPKAEEQDEIKNLIPDNIICEFQVSPKKVTQEAITKIITLKFSEPMHVSSGQEGKVVFRSIENKLFIDLQSDVEFTQSELSKIDQIVKSDGFYNDYQVTINNQTIKSDGFNKDSRVTINNQTIAAKIAYNNSKREKIIQKDDINNLIILLNTAKTLDEFIEGI